MKTAFLGLILAVLVGLPLLAALKVADKAPDFSARASLAGKEFNFSLEDALKKKRNSMPREPPSSAFRPIASLD